MKHLDPVATPDGIPNPSNPTLRLTVVMSGACPKCRNRLAVIGPGKEPHTAKLTCTRCRHARGWLAKQEIDFINKIVSTFGRPTAPIVLRSRLPASGAVRCQPGRPSSSAPGGHHHA
jgi:hypothetical protein